MALPHQLTITGSGFDAGEFFYGCNADITDGPPGSGSRGLAPGEDALSVNFNRAAYALAENDEYLYGAITREIALPVIAPLATFSGASIDIDPSGGTGGDINYTGQLYLGEAGWPGAGWTAQERLDQLFQILDENYQEVSVDGVEVKVTGLSGGSLGGGFVSTLVTLNLNKTLPSGNYRIGYFEQTDMATAPPWLLSFAGIRGLEEVSGELKEHKARLEIAALTAFSGSTIGLDPTAGAGGDYDLSPAGFVYLGGSAYTGGGLEEAGFLFQVLDEDYNPVVVNGTMVGVSSTSPVLGSGFYNGGVVTLTLNATLPSANYRLLLARNDNVAELADDALVKGTMRNAHRHLNYEAFTAVLTDGTNSTGGDYEGTNSVDVLDDDTYGGRFLLKRGVYEWSALTALPAYASIVGELLQWGASEVSNSTTISIPSGASSDVDLYGNFENVFLSSKSSSYEHRILGGTYKNVRVSPGTALCRGPISWNGGGTEFSASGASPSQVVGFSFSTNAEGIIENVEFYPHSTASQLVTVTTSKTLIFKRCTFDSSSVAGVPAMYIASSGKIRFEDCTFIGSDGGFCVQTLSANDIRFSRCNFSNDYGYLIDSNAEMHFEGCTYATGDSHRGGSITAVNTSTETFTLAGDHSELTSGDTIRVVGSTGNDGYWTVASTSGTGPTNITVNEDVTDATADGTIRYSSFKQIFALSSGTMRDCTMTINDANILRDTNSYPLIEIGGYNKVFRAGEMLVDGLEIIGSFNTIPDASFVTLYGKEDGYAASYNNVHLKNIPETTIDRGANGVLAYSSWLEINGSPNADRMAGCSCKNINVDLASAGAPDSVADTGQIVAARLAFIDGLSVDADAAGSGTGGFSNNNGALYFIASSVKDLYYCYENAFHCTGTCRIGMTSGTVIDGGTIHRVGNASGASALLFGPVTPGPIGAIIRNLNCPDILDWAAGLKIFWTNNDYCVFENNLMLFDNAVTSTASNLLDGSSYTRVVGNTIKIKRNVVEAVNTQSGSLVDSNIFDYDAGGATPTITNTGVTGDNVLSA